MTKETEPLFTCGCYDEKAQMYVGPTFGKSREDSADEASIPFICVKCHEKPVLRKEVS